MPDDSLSDILKVVDLLYPWIDRAWNIVRSREPCSG